MAETFQISPPLSQGVGYGIIVGVGAAFALGMSYISWYLAKYMNEKQVRTLESRDAGFLGWDSRLPSFVMF